jgi:hypothetical protein
MLHSQARTRRRGTYAATVAIRGREWQATAANRCRPAAGDTLSTMKELP